MQRGQNKLVTTALQITAYAISVISFVKLLLLASANSSPIRILAGGVLGAGLGAIVTTVAIIGAATLYGAEPQPR